MVISRLVLLEATGLSILGGREFLVNLPRLSLRYRSLYLRL